MFAGLKILELASVLAGPTAGQFFAELGAEVIKVENPGTGGDVTRSWKSAGEKTDDRSAYFCSCNWGKKSIALNLTNPEDLAVVQKLATQSDIIIASYKPGDAEKLGVDFEKLSRTNPRLVYGQVTGYGSHDDRVGYDAVIQAESGFMDLNGDPDGSPLKMPVALIDVLAAHHLKEGLLVALLQRERSGQGSLVEVSLMDAALASLANQATNWLVAGKVPVRQGSAHPNIAPYGDVFKTKDDKRILLAVGSDRQFLDLIHVLDANGDSVLHSPMYGTNQNRVENRASLSGLLSEKIGQLNSPTLLTAIKARKIPAGLVQTVVDALQQPVTPDLVMENKGIRGVRTFVGISPDFHRIKLSPPPHLGEHQEEIIERFR